MAIQILLRRSFSSLRLQRGSGFMASHVALGKWTTLACISLRLMQRILWA